MKATESPPPAAEDAPLVAGDATAPAPASNGARQSQWYQTTSILLAEIMGTGVLGLPAAMANLGWVLGVLSSVSFAAASTYAALLLSRVRNELYNSAESYADLALHTGGEGFAAFTRCTVLLTWSTLLPYYLLASAESMQGLFAGTGLALWQWTLVVAALLFLPLQARSLHQLTSLALASTVAIVIADAIILTVLVGEARRGAAPGATHSVGVPEGTSAIQVFGHLSSFTFAYQGHSVILEVVREMAEPRDFPRAVVVANIIMVGVYTATSAVGYAAFGRGVAGFLPDSLPDGPARRAVSLLLLFHTGVAYLIVATPLHRALQRIVAPHTVDQPTAAGRACWLGLSLAQLALSVVLATAVPFFSQFQDLLGALTGAPMVFGFPAFFFLRARHLKGVPVGWADALACGAFLCVLLPLFTLVGTYSSMEAIVRTWTAELAVVGAAAPPPP